MGYTISEGRGNLGTWERELGHFQNKLVPRCKRRMFSSWAQIGMVDRIFQPLSLSQVGSSADEKAPLGTKNKGRLCLHSEPLLTVSSCPLSPCCRFCVFDREVPQMGIQRWGGEESWFTYLHKSTTPRPYSHGIAQSRDFLHPLSAHKLHRNSQMLIPKSRILLTKLNYRQSNDISFWNSFFKPCGDVYTSAWQLNW